MAAGAAAAYEKAGAAAETMAAGAAAAYEKAGAAAETMAAGAAKCLARLINDKAATSPTNLTGCGGCSAANLAPLAGLIPRDKAGTAEAGTNEAPNVATY